jgi:branched-subunit amino acid transport protein
MSLGLVLLAILMGLVTYPSRAIPLLAPGIQRLPPAVLAYIRLVGPAVLASLAVVAVTVTLDAQRHPSFHVGVEWLAVAIAALVVVARRGLLLGLLLGAGIVAILRAVGVVALP